MNYKRFIKIPRKLLQTIDNKAYQLKTDHNTANEISQRLQYVPISNGSKIYHKVNVNVGFISDEFLYDNYYDTCTLVHLTPNNWEEKLETVQALIITSVWHGLSGEWNAAYKENSDLFQCLKQLCEKARLLKIPIGFYSKEDPPNFNVFIKIASLADVIFTSAAECIPKYKEIFPEKPCYLLSFCVNPIIHNPIRNDDVAFKNKVLFAGSFMVKYPMRTLQQTNMFDKVIQSGMELTIIDRNFHRGEHKYHYPDEYCKYVVPNFPYKTIAKIYKLFPFVINLNSVSDSETMFASRVYDASASGSLIISNESVGMKKMFPQIAVTEKEISDLFDSNDKDKIRKNLIRSVFRQKTVFENMAFMLEKMNVKTDSLHEPYVSVVVLSKTDHIIKQFNAQSYSYKIMQTVDQMLSDPCKTDMIMLWKEDACFDNHYIEDMVNVFKYTNCDYITSGSSAIHKEGYTDRLQSGYNTLFWSEKFNAQDILKMENNTEIKNGYYVN